jgi:23S rRNA (uracil1939-C5)-methyltransferase
MSDNIVTIEKLVSGGSGLARTDSGVVFVRDVLPGERVEIEPCGKQGGVAVARPVKVVEPSPARRGPPCPLYGKCGGCDWLPIVYKEQLAIKKEIVLDCFSRIGRIKNLPAFETISAQEFGYRHRVQIKIDGKGNAGFFARQTNDVVPVRSCPLLVGPLNDLLAGIADKKLPLPHLCKNLMAIAGDDERIASFPVIPGHTCASVSITVGGRTFEVPGSGFFQSNRLLLERLGAWARDHAAGAFCVDLYGGVGFFSIMLADCFTKGLLVESVGPQAADANKNFERNLITHFTAIEDAAENLVSLAGKKTIDCLVVDPPRTGLSKKVREAIATLKPKTFLYVSCDPSTQARDTGFLVNYAGFTIASAALFDLYPNTHHIESVLLLTRSK